MAHPVYRTAANTEKNADAISYARGLEHVPWCEDYEKMISGMLYDAGAPELIQSRFRSNRITHRYNTWFPDDVTLEALTAEREKMVRDIFGHAGKSPWLEAPFNVDYGCRLEYARGVNIGDDCWIGGGVNINAGVSIGEGSTIGSGSTVTRNIPPFSVAVGSPAKVVKTLEPDLPREEASAKP